MRHRGPQVHEKGVVGKQGFWAHTSEPETSNLRLIFETGLTHGIIKS